jgi:general secretion pathway protein D
MVIMGALTSTKAAMAKVQSCKTVEDCVNVVSKITGNQYVGTQKLKGKVVYTNNFVLGKSNADEFLSLVLANNGYTRIPLGNGKYSIIHARDVRYSPTPMYKASELDKLPNNWDYVMVEYKMKFPRLIHEVTRSFRPFMSRYGRIVAVKRTNTIIFQDTANNIRRLMNILESVDVEPSKDQLEKIKEDEKYHRELKMAEAKNCNNIKDELDELRRQMRGILDKQK